MTEIKSVKLEELRPRLKEYLSLMGHEPDVSGRYHCIDPNHDDRDPSLALYGGDEKNPTHFICYACLEENELIWLNGSLTEIKYAKLGDKVIQLDGSNGSITHIKEKQDSLIGISFNKLRRDPFRLTEDHPCIIVPLELALKNPYLRNEKNRDVKNLGSLKFYGRMKGRKRVAKTKLTKDIIKTVLAKDVQEGDYFLFPVNNLEYSKKEFQVLDTSAFVQSNLRGGRKYSISNLEMSYDLGRLLGLWLAEGSAYRGGISWSLCKDEEFTLAAEIQSILSNLGIYSSLNEWPEKPNSLTIYCSSTDLEEIFVELLGEYCDKKHLPSNVLEWPYEIRAGILTGWLDGDDGVTTSKHLAYGMFNLAISLGICPSLSFRDSFIGKDGISRKEYWVFNLVEESAGGFFEEIEGNLYYWLRVSNKVILNNSKVIDITVEPGHTFLSRAGIVHNCKQQGDIFTAAHILEEKPLSGPEFLTDNVAHVAAKFGLELKIPEIDDETSKRLQVRKLFGVAAEILMSTPKTTLFMKEVKRRKWDVKILNKMAVGCVTSYADFIAGLKAKGFTQEIIDISGLAMPSLFCESNMIFILKDLNDHPVYFVGRNLLFDSKDSTSKKYYNLKTTDYTPYSGLSTGKIFNMGCLKHLVGGRVYIVEGITDVISMIHHGITNVIAVLGSSFTSVHLNFLSEFGLYDIAFAFDGDKAGMDAALSAVRQMEQTSFLRSHVLLFPNGNDPDEYLRTHAIEEFNQLPLIDTFEYHLKSFGNDDKVYMLNKGVEAIILQPNVFRFNEMINILSVITNYSKDDIRSEVERKRKAISKSEHDKQVKEIQRALDRAVAEPGSILSLMDGVIRKLEETHKVTVKDSFNPITVMTEVIYNKKNDEEKAEKNISGFRFDKLQNLAYALNGDWASGKVLAYGGKPNTGKSAFMSQQAKELVEMNEDVTVLLHATDDTMEDYTIRFITQMMAEQMPDVTLNMVANPFFKPIVGHLSPVQHKNFIDLREYIYSKFLGYVKSGRLLIRDSRHGNTLSWAKDWVKFTKEKFSDRRVIFICDNLYNYSDGGGSNNDQRGRIIDLITFLKVEMAQRYEIAALTTIEYKKLGPDEVPNNNSIAETVAVEYKTNFVVHLDTNKSLYHVGPAQEQLPVVDMHIGKNKITGVKDIAFNLKFFPSQSYFLDGPEGVLTKAQTNTYVPDRARWVQGRRTEGEEDVQD